jgi:ribosomal protein L19
VVDADSLVETKTNPEATGFNVGDTVRVSAKVVEGDRESSRALSFGRGVAARGRT